MPKLIAPHGASWRGRALAPGETLDVTDAEAFHLAAHGFRQVEEDAPSTDERDFTGTADVPSASRTSGSADAGKMSAVPGMSAAALPEAADAGGTPALPVELPRKDLLKLLKGRGLGNLFVKPTEELRALAAIVLAGEKLAEAYDGRD
ncbi:MAG TPA: hypothetical protein VMU22_06565 [Rhizomicrobium sp.]|nr:hypothetical protein [Rhizomicrobium sp.]